MNEEKNPENAINKPIPIPSQESIRTYESDMAKVMSQKKTSSITIAIAENKRATGAESIATTPAKNYIKPLLMSLASLVLLAGGIFGGYYLYMKSPFAVPKAIPIPTVIPSIISYDKKVTANVGTATGDKLIQQISSEFNKNILPQGKILELVIQKNEELVIADISATEFIQKININMPDMLLRSLTDRWMLGTYSEETGSTPFIALTTDFFQNAFASMLSWEKTMGDDLKMQGQFADKQIRNRDVRVFTDNDGEILFLYSFINKETLIITATESAFMAIIDRIEKETYVR